MGRNYQQEHVNFPVLIETLRREYDIRASMQVTFTDEECAACDETFRAAVSNAGSLSVAQCPSFYRSMDAVILPSLLECFSATPLEAMVMDGRCLPLTSHLTVMCECSMPIILTRLTRRRMPRPALPLTCGIKIRMKQG